MSRENRFTRVLLLFIAALVFLGVSAGARADLSRELQSLYPHLPQSAIVGKMRAAKTPFLFFRSFVPYYYSLLAGSGGALPVVQKLGTYSGWCVGDAHIENFGAILDGNGSAFFSVNDMDDAGPCPLVADALRYFSSVVLLEGESAWARERLEEIVDSYLGALRGGYREPRKPVRKLLEKAEERGSGPKSKDLAPSDERLLREADTAELTRPVRLSLEGILRTEFGNGLRFLDAIEKKRTSGGSGGLARYRVLVRLPGFGKQVLELKELVAPGIYPLARGRIPDASERINRTLLLEQGRGASPLYRVVSLDGVSFLVRPRFAGNKGIDIEDYDSDELLKVMKDEAQVLGLLHRKESRAYAAAAVRVNVQVWVASSHQVAGWIVRAFRGNR